jgi:hypothetical protein
LTFFVNNGQKTLEGNAEIRWRKMKKGVPQMATFHNHDIDEKDSFLSGLDGRQLYAKRAGAKSRYEQPTLRDEETKEQDIYGFCGDLYCPHCQETFDFILIDFEQPFVDFFSAWREIIMREMGEDIAQCPRCGHRNMQLV